MKTTRHTYDLEERTGQFGESIIALCYKIKVNPITKHILDQLFRSATSVGANYMEANGASSKKDFRNKMHLVKKECQEAKYWLRMLAAAVPENKTEIRLQWQECHELNLIFQKILSTLQKRMVNAT